MNTYDIYLVGVGGQGVLTIGEIITEAAFRAGLPVNFYPTKGMAQRGGFVKAQLRMGRATARAGHPRAGRRPGDRDRGVRGAQGGPLRQAGRRFRPLRRRLAPAAVMLGKAPYPELEAVAGAGRGGRRAARRDRSRGAAAVRGAARA